MAFDIFLPFFLGCQNDDSGGGDIRSVLVSLPRLFHRDLLSAGNHERAIHTGTVSRYILARNVQQHV